MATTSISPDQDSIISEIHIATPLNSVFHALVDPGQACPVLGGQAGVYRCTQFDREFFAGAKGTAPASVPTAAPSM